MEHFSIKRIAAIIFVVVALIVVGLCSSSIFETNDAGNVQVKQAAVSGTMSCQLNPGMYLQNFGDIHTYKEASSFYFNKGQRGNFSLPTRFSDATKADVAGTVRVLLPVTNCEQMVKIHRKFRSFDGVMKNLVAPAMKKALFHSGPHMTADESYASRRGEFAALAEDQLKNGAIKTDKSKATRINPLTDEEQEIEVVTPRACDEENGTTCVNGLQRDMGAFAEFGISLTNFVIEGITYPPEVLAQIETQRKARMNIITQEAEAKEADARAKKAEAEARAKIEETRATEGVQKTQRIVRAEADKAEAVLQGEKVLEVAKLERQAAEELKRKLILEGEGQATKKRLVMQADGALAQKLDALQAIHQVWAEAYTKQRPTPDVVLGGSGNGGTANQFMDVLMVKAAKDLAVDLRVK
jgi:regulator of protease activity HflC (stomatin/prohibitin superfamily)